jgi:hypothetical protein
MDQVALQQPDSIIVQKKQTRFIAMSPSPHTQPARQPACPHVYVPCLASHYLWLDLVNKTNLVAAVAVVNARWGRLGSGTYP